MAKSKATDADQVPSERQLADYVAYAKRVARHLTMEQRKEIIAAMGNPEPAPPAPRFEYEPGKQYRFAMQHDDVSQEIVASNETDARAKFNDAMKRWPSPKTVKCELLGELIETESPIADLPPVDSAPISDLPPATDGGEQVKAPESDLGL